MISSSVHTMEQQIVIHPTAQVDPRATLGPGVVVGPFCVVGGDVCLGPGVQLLSHVCVAGRTTVGEGTRIFPFASVGHECQDLKYRGEPSTLEIGARNTIREYVTLHPGTEGGGMVTRIGDNNLLMVGVHVAHDCHIGNHVVLANQVTLGGHVTVGDKAIIGGVSAVHQFVTIGPHAIIGGMSGVDTDVIPFGSATGNRAVLQGLNWVGLKRLGLGKPELQDLRHAFYALFEGEAPLQERAQAVGKHYPNHPQVQAMVGFVQSSSRKLCVPARHTPLADPDPDFPSG